jgi:hypothetical protein
MLTRYLNTFHKYNPGDKDKIRRFFIEDVQNNTLGVNSHYVGREIHFTYPTTMIMAQKP